MWSTLSAVEGEQRQQREPVTAIDERSPLMFLYSLMSILQTEQAMHLGIAVSGNVALYTAAGVLAYVKHTHILVLLQGKSNEHHCSIVLDLSTAVWIR